MLSVRFLAEVFSYAAISDLFYVKYVSWIGFALPAPGRAFRGIFWRFPLHHVWFYAGGHT
jgi:hypothetical protein